MAASAAQRLPKQKMVNAGHELTPMKVQMPIGKLSPLDLLAELQTNPSSISSKARAAALRMFLILLKSIPTQPRATTPLVRFHTDAIDLSIISKATTPKLLLRPNLVLVISMEPRPFINVSREPYARLFSLLLALRLLFGGPQILF